MSLNHDINMNQEQSEEIVRRACGERPCEWRILAIDDVFEVCPHCHGTGYEPIGLNDVLLELHDKILVDTPSFGNRGIIGFHVGYRNTYHGEVIWWNLTIPTFEGQSEDTKMAIARLLSKE